MKHQMTNASHCCTHTTNTYPNGGL
ncbi:hypothetical protein DERP_007672 [Dermatophagoides pteronyssinus]|uniref:Uncharacterized protein n=1 Tax=Dermatophagoides pteronyssinus TaxID=6956 RepID=A0ABQ8JKW5_DERPT|nr:hypothetical protein DERP_007672 [Dermatophagoides pteronyssinus]